MKLNSAQLEAFYTVSQTLNFTKAADQLAVTQSALSQRIAKLEEDLETTLFLREKTSIKLTEAGQKVLRYCQQNFSLESELVSELKGSQNTLGGLIKIGTFSSVARSLVMPAFKNLLQVHDQLSIKVMINEMHEIEGLLKSTQAEYIITTNQTESHDLESILLGYEENVLVSCKKQAPQNIYLDHDENDLLTMQYLKTFKYKTTNMKRRYFGDVYGLIDGVKLGLGQALLPLHLIKEQKDLEVLEPKKILKIPIYLQFYKQPYYKKTHPFVVQNLVNFFKAHL